MNKKYFCIFVVLIFITGTLLGFFSNNLFEKTQEKSSILNSTLVNEIISYNKNLTLSKEIFENCSQKENESEKLFCVQNYAKEHFNYSLTEGVYSIDEMFEKGADCKSYSVYYATLATMLNYDYAFFVMPNHIMTIAYFERGYCVLDMDYANCVYFKGTLNEEVK